MADKTGNQAEKNNLPETSNLPEDNVDWSQRFQGRCHFYPGRDCPGCQKTCARGFGNILAVEEQPTPREEPAEPQATHFRSCPACRGSGKLDLRCSICQGRGSVNTDSEGRMDAGVTDGTKRLLEAARVAVLPTAEFERMKANFQNEAIEWALRWLTMRARNMQATQDYVGEHRLNQAVELMRNDWKELADE